MRDFLTWNVNLGRWAGVQVRVHALFLVLIAVTLLEAARGQPHDFAWFGVFWGILLASVVLHEIGHCVAARKLGGTPHQVVLWPLGGLVQVSVPPEPLAECFVALAGPLVNLALALVGAAVLLFLPGDWLAALHPFSPLPQAGGLTWLGVVQLFTWVNLWLLLAINLIPALPMDGGRALRAGLWHFFGYRWAVVLAAWATQAAGLGLCAAAWWAPDFARLPLLLLGAFLFFTARHPSRSQAAADYDDWPDGYDLSQGDPAATAREGEGPFSLQSGQVGQWVETRHEEKLRRQREAELEEDRRVDEILARLHETGIEGLSPEDRAVLNRVSARYRNRQQG